MLIGFERHIVAFKRHYFVYGLSHDKDIFALDILCLFVSLRPLARIHSGEPDDEINFSNLLNHPTDTMCTTGTATYIYYGHHLNREFS